MTIGIGAYGPNAGEAVFRALQKAERIGENSIHGFAVYAVIKENGEVVYYKTQRGGSTTLVTKGEITGVLPPPDVLGAKIAGVISSGPDRKIDPLERILPADGRVGLVTGHRIPLTGCRVHGEPVNGECLELMGKGLTAKDSVEKVIDDNLDADVGLIAVDVGGGIHLRNSDRVSRRPDMAEILRIDRRRRVGVAVLTNEISPVPATAEVAAETAWDILTSRWKTDGEIVIRAGFRLETGPRDEVHVDKKMVVRKIVISDRFLMKGEQICCVPYFHSMVVKTGKVIARTVSEPLSVVRDGVIEDLSGQKAFPVAIKYCGD